VLLNTPAEITSAIRRLSGESNIGFFLDAMVLHLQDVLGVDNMAA
jgi:hypothetical protein